MELINNLSADSISLKQSFPFPFASIIYIFLTASDANLFASYITWWFENPVTSIFKKYKLPSFPSIIFSRSVSSNVNLGFNFQWDLISFNLFYFGFLTAY